MNKHVEGLRLLADILENEPLDGQTYAGQSLDMILWFDSTDSMAAAGAVFGQHEAKVFGEGKGLTVNLAHPANESWPGVRMRLLVNPESK